MWTEDRNELRRLSFFCYERAQPLLDVLPANRESQKLLVLHLADCLAVAHPRFSISREFLANEVHLRDMDLLVPWSSNPIQLAWLMVHEELSSYFARYAIALWNPDVYMIHHVPKSAGTSLCAMVEASCHFIAYPQTFFESMCSSYGLMGFAIQLVTFETSYKTDRLYVGGHFNLPDKIDELGLHGRCRGVSVCRAPTILLSSAIRYTWTKIEQGDQVLLNESSINDSLLVSLEVIRRSIAWQAGALSLAGQIVCGIINSSSFRAEYDELLVRYYLNKSIRNADDLKQIFEKNCQLVPLLRVPHDLRDAAAALQVQGQVPHSNSSALDRRSLELILGGAQRLRELSAERMAHSQQLFQALCDVQCLRGL